jgi:hypothetical protein
MKAKVVVHVLASCALAASAAPAAASHGSDGASCVGLFASHTTRELPPGEFGSGISAEAKAARPFGLNVVGPFAHERIPCP